MRLQFSKIAQSDIEEMARYGIFHWGEESAYTFINKFIEDLDILTQNPAIGKQDGDDRNINFGNYRVIYNIKGEFIYIISIEPKGRSRE